MTLPTQNHDVIIAGGGLAGLTLAIQLKSHTPELDVVVLGKSSISCSSNYCQSG